MNPAALQRSLEMAQATSAASRADLERSCTRSMRPQADGSFSLELRCTTERPNHWETISIRRFEWSARSRSFRTRGETTLVDPDRPYAAKPFRSDTTMVNVGDCPVPMRPAQTALVLDADGRPLDTPSEFLPENQAHFAQGVRAAVLAAATKADGARVLSVDETPFQTACGWIDLGGSDGVAPFIDFGSDGGHDEVLIARAGGTDFRRRIDAAFARRSILSVCKEHMPEAPPGAVADRELDAALRQLWAEHPPRWAIVPALGPGFVGVSRRGAGGDIQTPVFRSMDEARRWIASTGNRMASALDAEGERASVSKPCRDNTDALVSGICLDAWPGISSLLEEPPESGRPLREGAS